MTIQRQYSLPNCKLVLQGLNDANGASGASGANDASGRPLLSMVTNVECHLAGQKMPLTGGRDFLNSLVTAVSDYVQGYLSGIQHLVRRDRQQSSLVQIQQLGSNLHRLSVSPEAGAASEASLTEVDLTTVQLFDLVEAIDQLYADAQTLPDLTLRLEPLSKRRIISQEPVAKRAAPVALGVSGLAAAAAVLFMLPVPEVRRPETQTEGATTEQSASPSPTSTASPANPAASPPDTANAGAGTDLTAAPEITDPTELDQLTVQLYDRLDRNWTKNPTFDGELVYRVGVDRNGEIVGYKYANEAALSYLSDTPLADVQFDTAESTSSTTSTETASQMPLAQFRVVFKSDGVLEVSPWNGQVSEDSSDSSDSESENPEQNSNNATP